MGVTPRAGSTPVLGIFCARLAIPLVGRVLFAETNSRPKNKFPILNCLIFRFWVVMAYLRLDFWGRLRIYCVFCK